LTENSVLLGSPAVITETLKKVEEAGFSEVTLYFNGRKIELEMGLELASRQRSIDRRAPTITADRNYVLSFCVLIDWAVCSPRPQRIIWKSC
jgi:hypothetical protein